MELRLALGKVSDPASAILYEMRGATVDLQHHDMYLQVAREIDIRFGRVVEAAPPQVRDDVRDIQQEWALVDAALRRLDAHDEAVALGELGTPAGIEGLWARYRSLPGMLADVERSHVAELERRVDALHDQQRLVVAALTGVLALALLTTALSARHLSRRVVQPVAHLRRAAAAMRDAQQLEPVDVSGASAELQELAATIEETAAVLRASHGELRDQAYTDALTGLPNRTAFFEELALRYTRADHELAVLFVDLDDFKVVNDSLGHAAGDELLRVVAQRLSEALRSQDHVARLGGDEFAVLADVDALHAVQVGEKVLRALDGEVVVAGARVAVGCSVGVATTGRTVESAEDLVRNADFAMYVAKGRGKSCVEAFAPSMHLAMQAQLELKRDLSQAASRGELVLHHQPVLSLDTGEVLGFEALVRWQHPARGLLFPDAFIGLAEETGDVVGLGAWVLDRACADVAAQRRAAGTDLWVSVNVSAQQLTVEGFVDGVLAALAAHGVPATALVLEITEHVAVTNGAGATAALEALRAHGVRIALDDFGVGFSSLRYLRELPVDVLKLDRSFVCDASPRAQSLLSGMVSLAGSLGLAVVAEGIEEAEQCARLRSLGAMAGQGYLFARPMPVEDLARHLAAGRAVVPAQRSAQDPVTA